MIERELRFTDEDMALFAAGSGDSSPLHTDRTFGRCTAYGDCIVYGGLLSIGLLGSLPGDALARVRTVRSSFPGPVLTGKISLARAVPHPTRADVWEVKLLGRGKVLARLIAESRRAESSADATLARAAAFDPEAPEHAGPLGVGDAITGAYEAGPELTALARRFAAERLHPALLDGIGWASYIVGMGMPGFQGLCAAVDLTIAADGVPENERCARGSILVRDHDDRSQRRLVEGVLSGTSGAARTVAQVECFPVALPPLPNPAAVGLSTGGPTELRGSVVVVGGSRGFGAALSLALLAQGYAVHVVYATSSETAAGLARLASPHGDRFFLHRIDVREPGPLAGLIQALRDSDTSLEGLVLNAAAPPLGMGLTGESGGELADYVADSLRLAAVPLGALLPLLDGDRGWVAFTSAAAVTSPVRDLPQFVSAKAALEGLAGWVAVTAPRARILVIRPPEMRTGVDSRGDRSNGVSSSEEVAAWVVEHIAGNELPPGLSILEPGAAKAAAR